LKKVTEFGVGIEESTMIIEIFNKMGGRSNSVKEPEITYASEKDDSESDTDSDTDEKLVQ